MDLGTEVMVSWEHHQVVKGQKFREIGGMEHIES